MDQIERVANAMVKAHSKCKGDDADKIIAAAKAAIAAATEFDLAEMAWVIIANSYGGDWELASPDWKRAAEKWRDEYHKTLPNSSDRAVEAPPAPEQGEG